MYPTRDTTATVRSVSATNAAINFDRTLSERRWGLWPLALMQLPFSEFRKEGYLFPSGELPILP